MRLWDAQALKSTQKFEGHTHGVSAACFSPCGKFCASGSFDCSVRLWKVEDGKCVWSTHANPVLQADLCNFAGAVNLDKDTEKLPTSLGAVQIEQETTKKKSAAGEEDSATRCCVVM